jgi:hypothetical protein
MKRVMTLRASPKAAVRDLASCATSRIRRAGAALSISPKSLKIGMMCVARCRPVRRERAHSRPRSIVNSISWTSLARDSSSLPNCRSWE